MRVLLVIAMTVGLAAAFHPYLNMKSEEVDSEEHGVRLPSATNTSCRCGWANRASSRIVGGRQAEENQFPWMAALTIRWLPFVFCGGTIISEQHVITAAHCTQGQSTASMSVLVGHHKTSYVSWIFSTDNSRKINIKSIHDHPGYNHETTLNDISILNLNQKITFTDKIGPACLPSARNAYNLEEKYIKVMGWGRVKTDGDGSKVLLHTNLRVIPLVHCARSFRGLINLNTPTQMCTFSNNRDTCQGDSGGPLLYVDPQTNMYTLVGLVSYGAECASFVPGVNTEVAAFLPWIQDTIKATSDVKTCKKI